MAVACPNAYLLHREDEGSREVSEARQWFAVQVKARREKLVQLQLQRKDYECFLPLYTTKRLGYDRVRQHELPLFPGYLFCRLDPVKRLPVLITPGVMQIVGVAKEPVPIDDGEIAAIHCILLSGLAARPCPYQLLQVGQRVRIEHGPLSGLEGILIRFKNHQRLIVSVTLLQRSVAVEIDNDVSTLRPN